MVMSLLPAKNTFTIWRGTTFNPVITLYTDAAGTVLKDLTGNTSSMKIWDKPQGTLLMTLDTGVNGGITLGGTAGTATFLINSATTQGLTWNAGYYEWTLTNPSSVTDIILFGAFRILGT